MKREREIYREKLNSPKWQFVRRLIFARDDYTCQSCGAKREWKYTLEVHHKRYIAGREPWEYPSNYLVTLCSKCHRNIHGHDYIKPDPTTAMTAKEIITNMKKEGLHPWHESEL